MPDMNMDNIENPEATMPVMEFTVPTTEVDGMMDIGQVGEIIIPVEVISRDKTSITFRKAGAARTDKHFQQESAKDMRKKVKVLSADESYNSFKEIKSEEK